MGWFTSRYPVRFSYQRDAGEHLLAVKNNLRRWSQRAENFGVLCGLPVVREDGISINYGQDGGGVTGRWITTLWGCIAMPPVKGRI